MTPARIKNGIKFEKFSHGFSIGALGKLYRLRLNVYSDRSEINFAEEQVYLIKRKDYDDYVLSSGYYLREEKEQIEFTQAEIDKLGGLADGFIKEEV